MWRQILNRFKCSSKHYTNNLKLFKCQKQISGTIGNFAFNYNNVQTRNFYPNRPLVIIASVLSLLGLVDEEGEETPESVLITTIKRGILLIQKEEFEKAEQMLHVALKLAQEYQNHDGITYVYDVLANLAFDTNQFEKAEKLFVAVLHRLIGTDLLPPTDNKVVHISLKLAHIYDQLKDPEKAENGYQFCLDNLDKKVSEEKDDSDDTILLQMMALWEYGHFLLYYKRPAEALICLEKALKHSIWKEKETSNSNATSILNDLGTACCMLGDFDKAVEYFEQAIQISNNVDSTELSVIFINLGDVYFIKQMYDKAKKSCDNGKRIAKYNKEDDYVKEADECLIRIKDQLNA